ncbi:hypothetical protein MRBLMN1_005874 [Chitinophaga ginsengisegetis]|uniref:hypothetical protein n=1 Tax=Chitinophaga ginsengisegetis TaxID=393003 RepID=UPI0034237295
MAKSFRRALNLKYIEIKPDLLKCFNFPVTDLQTEQYKAVLIAAFAKCFEFNLDISKQRNLDNSFYLMSFLRGICEDLITLKFIKSLTLGKRNHIMSIYSLYLSQTSIEAQEAYFDSQKIDQPLLKTKGEEAEKKSKWS